MRHKLRLPYCGLTIVLSNPSRFDNHAKELISGTAGHFFQTKCLGERISRHACDIRTSDTIGEGILSGTRALLLLGDKAFNEWTNGNYRDYSINEQRGCPLKTNYAISTIASYYPQDAIDIQDYESRLNPQDEGGQEDDAREDEDEDDSEVKRKGRTRRTNYRFWLERDTKKIISRLSPSLNQSVIPSTGFERRIAPASEEVIAFLRSIKHEDNLYMDIETSVDGGYNLFCIGVSTDTSPVYVFPIFKWDGSLFYSAIACATIFRALAYAMGKACVVTHNGFGFDLLVLAWRYKLPFGHRHYDTMVAHHRVYPEVEKSLGHCLSLWTWEEYHKDEGCFNPRNMNDLVRLMEYNSKDVHGMRLIKAAIEKHATKIPGLRESIAQGMDTIYPYTLCSLAGINFDDIERQSLLTFNDRKMTQYLRWLELLKPKEYKPRILPTSSKSCVLFFHDFLNYDVVGRSRNISKKTGRPLNTPSLNEKNIYKLKLKYPENIMLDICIAYRRLKKMSGMLGFEPWDINKLPC